MKGGEEAELKPEVKYVRVCEAEGDEEGEVTQEEIVMGYRYGREIVTISEEDEALVKFDGGPKSMTLFGFLPLSELKFHQLVGDGAMIFLPNEGDVNSGRAWSTLVQAMLELKILTKKCSAIRRKEAIDWTVKNVDLMWEAWMERKLAVVHRHALMAARSRKGPRGRSFSAFSPKRF